MTGCRVAGGCSHNTAGEGGPVGVETASEPGGPEPRDGGLNGPPLLQAGGKGTVARAEGAGGPVSDVHSPS
jgi:hypothetical protein